MNSTNIINAASRGTGLKGWYMNKTLCGKALVKKALKSQYGKQDAVLKNGVLKHSKRKNNSIVTTYLSKYFRKFQTTLKTYDNNGRRFSLTSYGENPKNYHYRTSLQVTDYDKYNRRESIFKRLRYNSDSGLWDIDYLDKKTIIKTDDGITITRTIKDYLKQTVESFTENVPNEKLERIRKLFKVD